VRISSISCDHGKSECIPIGRPIGIQSSANSGSVTIAVSGMRRITASQPERVTWAMSTRPKQPSAIDSITSYAHR